jgi:hypothetical protein
MKLLTKIPLFRQISKEILKSENWNDITATVALSSM